MQDAIDSPYVIRVKISQLSYIYFKMCFYKVGYIFEILVFLLNFWRTIIAAMKFVYKDMWHVLVENVIIKRFINLKK